MAREKGLPCGREFGSCTQPAASARPQPRIELPVFSGKNPSGWISRANQFFRIENIAEDMKLEYAFVAMEGPALHWLQMVNGASSDYGLA